MDYKWNIYTADIKFEYNKTYTKRFKKYDNWIEHECSITRFKKWGWSLDWTIFVVANSIDDALIRLDKYIDYENLVFRDVEIDLTEKYDIRNFKICKPYIIKKSIKELIEYKDSESVIEYLKERVICYVGR